MPGGRPPLPGTAEEKARARRERVRANVRAHRARKKNGELGCASEERDLKALGFRVHDFDCMPDNEAQLWNPPLMSPVDISEVSCLAPIDTSFGSMFSMIHDFERITGRYPWVLALQQFPTEDRIVDIAMAAAGSAFLSRLSNDVQLEAFSRQSYHCALTKLQSRMENLTPEQNLMLSTVSNSLMTFESANGAERTINSAWGAHAQASMHFMEQAGPAEYRSDVGRRILRSNRLIALQMDIHERKPCFLDTEAWKTIPFEPNTKNHEDELWDHMIAIPELISQADVLSHRLHERNPAAMKTAFQLRERISHIQSSIRQWILKFYTDPSSRPTRSHRKAAWFHVDLPSLFPYALYYIDHSKAESHMCYWTSLLYLHLLIRAVAHGLQSAGLAELAESFYGLMQDDAYQIAANICQSMEFCIGVDENDLRGSLYAGFMPLQVSLRYFKTDELRYEQHIEWCKLVSSRITNRGMHYPEYVNKDAPGDSVLYNLYRL